MGRTAQNALYFHDGPTTPAPQQLENYHYQMSIPAGVRKTGPWQVGLSGIVETSAINSQFYLDRQSAVSVFHKKTGPIIDGSNSKRQPELATFRETYKDAPVHMPLSSRLQMSDAQDRLSLALLNYFVDLYVPKPSPTELTLRVVTSRKGPPGRADDDAAVASGPRVKRSKRPPGKKFQLSSEHIEPFTRTDRRLDPPTTGWTMKVHPASRLSWPVYPFNP